MVLNAANVAKNVLEEGAGSVAPESGSVFGTGPGSALNTQSPHGDGVRMSASTMRPCNVS